MCLKIKKLIPKKAKKDILVEKQMLVTGQGLISPYYHKDIYKFGKEYKATGLDLFDLIKYKEVEGGFFHSKSHIQKQNIPWFDQYYDEDYYIIECKIPKGTFYYEENDPNLPGEKIYASRKIEFIKLTKVIKFQELE